MRRILGIIIFTVCVAYLHAQEVSNVKAEQVGKNIVVSYDLDRIAKISVCYSTDGGKTYSSSIRRATGDIGNEVTAGHKKITWNVLDEIEKLVCGDLVFKVIADGTNETFAVNGVSFEMVFVKGGTFMMGSLNKKISRKETDGWVFIAAEDTAHYVELSDYHIGKYEVTQALWEAVMGSNPSREKGVDNPVTDVSWYDCQRFVAKLNTMLSSQLGNRKFALPTEAQWEYAARGGKNSRGYKYSGSNNLNDVAWYSGNSGGSLHIVGTKLPNELGLYDMSGNVFEWCYDWTEGCYRSGRQQNPTGPSDGCCSKVFRGGCYYSKQFVHCNVCARMWDWVDSFDGDIGFRLVLIS